MNKWWIQTFGSFISLINRGQTGCRNGGMAGFAPPWICPYLWN